MKRVLMCPPTYFSIDYVINPWMDTDNQVDKRLAEQQWQAIHDYYVSHRVTVELIEPVQGQPDMVFTANGGIVREDIFICSNHKHPERKGEEQHFQKWFKEHGYTVKTLDHHQGGEGEALFFRDTMYLGYGFRSEPESHQEIAQIAGIKTVSLKLIDPCFYDFDMVFCPVGDKCILYYPSAFDAQSQIILQEIPQAVPITKTQAENFLGNSVFCNGTLLTSYVDEKISVLLAKVGVSVKTFNMSEFKKSGGGIKCITLYLN